MSSQTKRGFTLIELLVVIAIIAILASILFPVFAKAREKARQTTCTSQVRQLATAVQMYVQDNNGKFPGITLSGTTVSESWGTKLETYVGNQKMFHCPSDANTEETAVSYAYNGLLVKLNGDGVAESQIAAPTDVGAVCDADPSSAEYGLLGGAAHLTMASPYYKTPSPRHGGVIVGYCDGHAKYAPGKSINEKKMDDPVTRAFYMAVALGLVDNPAGGVNDAGPTTGINTVDTVTIGGDYCTRPILLAAAEIWKKAGGLYTQAAFRGSLNDRDGAAQANRTVFGTGNPLAVAGSAIAKDAMVVIVAKNTKVKVGAGGADLSATFKHASGLWINTATIERYYETYNGYTADVVQCYTYDKNSGSRVWFYHNMNIVSPSQDAEKALLAANDAEMVEKVAADPYGIGYCSAAFADLDRVTILGLVGGGTAGTAGTVNEDNYYPSGNSNTRWELQTAQSGDGLAEGAIWRTLKVIYSGGGASNQFYATMFSTTHASLRNGPLFKASYYTKD